MLAVETKDERVVRLILDAVGVEDARQLVNLQTRAGNSALHLAVGLQGVPKELKRGMLKMLIKFGGELLWNTKCPVYLTECPQTLQRV